MPKDFKIPVLTELIEKGEDITMSDLGLDDGPRIDDPMIDDLKIDEPIIDETIIDITLPNTGPVDLFTANPELEQSVRRILDEHMELAWQEIRLAIQRAFEKSRD
jgi:hypothetical protein